MAEHRISMWLLCGGIREDLQSLVTLSLGFQDAGFNVTIASHSDFAELVTPSGIKFVPIGPSLETVMRDNPNIMDNALRQGTPPDAEGAMFWPRFWLSARLGRTVQGVNVVDGIPCKTAWQCPEASAFHAEQAAIFMRMRDSDADVKFLEASVRDSVQPRGARNMIKRSQQRGGWLDEPAGERRERFRAELQSIDPNGSSRGLGLGLHIATACGVCNDSDRAAAFMQQLAEDSPEIVLYTGSALVLALEIQGCFDIPAVPLSLRATGGELQMTTCEDSNCMGYLTKQSQLIVLEEDLCEPLFKCTPIKDMAPHKFDRLVQQGALVGFLEDIAKAPYCDVVPGNLKQNIKTNHYVGFWMDNGQMQADDTNTDRQDFGRVGHFVATSKEPPVYVGWGSCTSTSGAPWMCFLAVAALKEANQRGIILKGWAGLTLELLQEIVGPEDAGGYHAYATEHILFVDEVSETWLFPKCAAVVIQGDTRPLSLAWQSGTPTVVCPVWTDQYWHARIHERWGGVRVDVVDACDPRILAEKMLHAISSPIVKESALKMRDLVSAGDGVNRAIEHVDACLATYVPYDAGNLATRCREECCAPCHQM